MFKYIKKRPSLMAFLLTVSVLVTMLTWPVHIRLTSMLVLLISIGTTTGFIIKNHWLAYQQAECTREKMTRNLILDLLGLLLTMGAAMYVGRLAGGYFGFHAGFWIGLLAGFVGGFLAAGMVRSMWGKLVSGLA